MIAQTHFHGLISGFLRSAERFPDRDALAVNNEVISYNDLRSEANRIAIAIASFEPEPCPLAAVFAYRSKTAYSGVLGVLISGKGYVPLNPKFPVERTRRMLISAGCRVLVVGNEASQHLPELLRGIGRSLTVILPEVPNATNLASLHPEHRFV